MGPNAIRQVFLSVRGNISGNLDTYRGKRMRRHREKTASTSQGDRPGADASSKALRKNQSCQHLHLRLLVSKTVRQYICVVSATKCVALCFTVLANQNKGFLFYLLFFHSSRLNDYYQQCNVSSAEITKMNDQPLRAYSLTVYYLRHKYSCSH